MAFRTSRRPTALAAADSFIVNIQINAFIHSHCALQLFRGHYLLGYQSWKKAAVAAALSLCTNRPPLIFKVRPNFSVEPIIKERILSSENHVWASWRLKIGISQMLQQHVQLLKCINLNYMRLWKRANLNFATFLKGNDVEFCIPKSSAVEPNKWPTKDQGASLSLWPKRGRKQSWPFPTSGVGHQDSSN